MKTEIDNNKIVFMLIGDMNKSIFCNLKSLKEAYLYFDDKDNVKFYYFFNNEKKRIFRKKLNQMLESNELNFRF